MIAIHRSSKFIFSFLLPIAIVFIGSVIWVPTVHAKSAAVGEEFFQTKSCIACHAPQATVNNDPAYRCQSCHRHAKDSGLNSFNVTTTPNPEVNKSLTVTLTGGGNTDFFGRDKGFVRVVVRDPNNEIVARCSEGAPAIGLPVPPINCDNAPPYALDGTPMMLTFTPTLSGLYKVKWFGSSLKGGLENLSSLQTNPAHGEGAAAPLGSFTVATAQNNTPIGDAGPDQSVVEGDTVTLNGMGSTDVDGDILTYKWLMATKPAGTTAALSDPLAVMPTFIADMAGTYKVELTVNDGTVDSTPSTVTISVNAGNTAPVANAGPNQTVNIGDTVTLNGSDSTDVDLGDTLTYQWSMTTRPIGSTAALSDPFAVMPTFIADTDGIYVTELIVNDGTVNSLPSTVTISVNAGNTAPVANAGPNQTVNIGDTVTLNGSDSTDVDLGDTLAYQWSITTVPEGSTAVLSGANTVISTFIPDISGDYVAQLIVNDGFVNGAPSTVKIAVNAGNTAPVADAGPPQSVDVGDIVTLNGSGSADVDVDDVLTFNWSMISIPEGSTSALSDPNMNMPTFIADTAGTYVVQLIVNDGMVDSAPSTVMISTNAGNIAPLAIAGPDQTVNVGDTVRLNGMDSTDVDGDVLSYKWSMIAEPAGSNASLSDPNAAMPTLVIDSPGYCVVQLIVNDGMVDSAPDTMSIFAQTKDRPKVKAWLKAKAERSGEWIKIKAKAKTKKPMNGTMEISVHKSNDMVEILKEQDAEQKKKWEYELKYKPDMVGMHTIYFKIYDENHNMLISKEKNVMVDEMRYKKAHDHDDEDEDNDEDKDENEDEDEDD